MRESMIYKADDTASCYAKAIAGEAVPQLPLMAEALHSEGQSE